MAFGKATIDITANLKPLRAGIAKARSAIKSMVKGSARLMKTGFTAAFSAIKSGLRTITRLAKITAAALLGIGIASVKVASDVEESENLFVIAMGNMADEANIWAQEYSKALNLFDNNTKKSLSTFQLMLTSMGLGTRESFEMSKGLVKLTNDIASFRNQKPDEMFLKLAAGITGEAEPLKRLGILVNDNVIKQLALADATIMARMAVKGASKELTEMEKVMLRYRAIVKATSLDTGDMERTLDSTSNVFKQVWQQVQRTANTIGQSLIPVVTEMSIAMREWLVGNQDTIGKWADFAVDKIKGVIDWWKTTIDLAKKGKFSVIFKEIGRIFGEIGSGLVDLFVKLAPIAKDLGGEIFKGFQEAAANTKLGKFLGAAKKVARVALPSFDVVSDASNFIGKALSRQPAPVRLTESAQKSFDELQRMQLEEMKRLNKNIERQTEDF